MFNSGQFVGALNNFQQLLSEGMFDSSEPGMSARILQHFQQLLTISDLNNSGWMEQSSQLQSHGKCQSGSSNFFKVHTLAHIYVESGCMFKGSKHKEYVTICRLQGTWSHLASDMTMINYYFFVCFKMYLHDTYVML
jgi:hypothetical protein